MENRLVALAALENLFHWPLSSGHVLVGAADGDSGGADGGASDSKAAQAGDANLCSREPWQRKQDRYRAVLLLPALCQKLGSAWTAAEVVPYLLRSIEEEDAQLALVAGIALLGMTLPRPSLWTRAASPEAAAASSSGSSSNSQGMATTSAVSGSRHGAYLSVEDAQPVCIQLASSSCAVTRQFAAQVVLPHLSFGVSLERDITLESWDLKFVPLSTLRADLLSMDTTATSSTSTSSSYPLGSLGDVEDDVGTAVGGTGDGNEASLTRFVATVRKQLALRRRRKPTSTAASDADTAEIHAHCYALATQDEALQFLYHGDVYARLTGPWMFHHHSRLASLAYQGGAEGLAMAATGAADRSTDGAGLLMSGAGGGPDCGGFCPLRKHSRRTDDGQTLRGAPPAASRPLFRADLQLCGAACASDAASVDCDGENGGGGGGGDDLFSLNVRARVVVSDLVTWMEGLSPFAVDVEASRGRLAGPLTFVDYIYCAARRTLLCSRWRALLTMLEKLLTSPYPGPVAVAIEVISVLLQAIHVGSWEAELLLEAGAENFLGIRAPPTPLLTTAELQRFVFRTTRRHVAFCIAAAASAADPALPLSTTQAELLQQQQLLRASLATARGTLEGLLLRHRLLQIHKGCREAVEGDEGGCCGVVVLQVGPGPCEARVPALSGWDASFAPTSRIDATGVVGMPDDTLFLFATSQNRAEAGKDSRPEEGDDALWLPSIINAVSAFRLHRIPCLALLRALPLTVDFLSLFHAAAPVRDPLRSEGGPLSLATVCPLVLQMLVPHGALAPFMQVLRRAAEQQQSLVGESENGIADGVHHQKDGVDRAGATRSLGSHPPDVTDPTSSTSALWAALRAPGILTGEPSVSPTRSAIILEESPASLDYGLLEATLDAVQRLTAEAAVQLSATRNPSENVHASFASTSPRPDATLLDAVGAQLFTLLAASLRWVPRYVQWKARWGIVRRLPQLVATFCLFLKSVSALRSGNDRCSAAASVLPRPSKGHAWLQLTLQLLTSLWTCAAQFGTSPLNDLVDDEEVEVRCVAVVGVAQSFRVMTEAALLLSADAASFSSPRRYGLLLPQLTEPLSQALDATAQCVLVAAREKDARVRCRSAEALADLSRALSLLVVADTPSESNTTTPSTSANPVWRRYLHSNADALLLLMTDEKPVVQLALVSQLTELLLMRAYQPSRWPRAVAGEGSSTGLDGNDGDGPQRSAGEIQQEALLGCLRRLAHHELWRLREQYAKLLARLCGRLLLATATATTTSLAHTHPLYRFARTELLTLLVEVLFDKVKAVRDAALDAVEQMCRQLAEASRRSGGTLSAEAVGTGYGISSNSQERTAHPRASGCSPIGCSTPPPNTETNVTPSFDVRAFVEDVLWPRINAHTAAWETYLSRSALLYVALRLRVDKATVFLPLLDQLARDPVLNVRLVVAKVILEVLLRSSPEVTASMAAGEAEWKGDDAAKPTFPAATFGFYKPELPSGTVAYHILMNKPLASFHGGRVAVAPAKNAMDAMLPLLQFDEEERAGVILTILRLLLEDSSSDVRDEAAKALKVCF